MTTALLFPSMRSKQIEQINFAISLSRWKIWRKKLQGNITQKQVNDARARAGVTSNWTNLAFDLWGRFFLQRLREK